MRLAVISDIHSNLHALSTVRESIEDDGAELVVCAGDTVGYGAFPNECCSAVKQLAGFAILGNHEIAAASRMTTFMNPYAAEAVLWTSDQLSRESRGYIESMRSSVEFAAGRSRAVMFHGSPSSVDDYIYENEANEDLFGRLPQPVMILGHTHVPFIRRFNGRMILNPGAVGQPRDGDPRASYAVLDTTDLSCEIKRVDYDIESAAEAILSAGLPAFLANRLFDGR